MKKNELYYHYKTNNEYQFKTIALPLEQFDGNRELLSPYCLAYDANTPDDEKEPRRAKLYYYRGVMFVNREVPHVVYQAEKEYGTDDCWVRRVDDYFGYVKKPNGEWVKRFSKEKQ